MLECMKTLFHTLFHRIASVLHERWYLQLALSNKPAHLYSCYSLWHTRRVI
jgi:hypothetical protein